MHIATTSSAQRLHLACGLDTFRRRSQFQRRCELNNRTHNRARFAFLVVIQRIGKGAIDFEFIQRETAQIGERRIAGAKVIERNVNAERTQRIHSLARATAVLNQ